MDPSKLSQSDMVLLSMNRLSKGTTARLPYEEIVLQAWRDYPDVFSLRSHPEHPDASDIHKKIYQTLRPGGLVVSLGNKVFRLTDKGISRANQLEISDNSDKQQEEQALARLSRSEDTFLKHALQSEAFSLWQKDETSKLIDHDVRQFFQFSTGTSFADRNLKLQFAMDTFSKYQKLNTRDGEMLLGLTRFFESTFRSMFEGETS